MEKEEMMKKMFGAKYADKQHHQRPLQHSQSLDLPNYMPKYLHRQASLDAETSGLTNEDDDGGGELRRVAGANTVAAVGAESGDGMYDKLAVKLFGSMINRGGKGEDDEVRRERFRPASKLINYYLQKSNHLASPKLSMSVSSVIMDATLSPMTKSSPFPTSRLFKTAVSTTSTTTSTAIASTFTYPPSSPSSSAAASSSSYQDIYQYKNNEFYSIVVSMLTAAILLLFIMWRWFRMKADLRKALREQMLEQREQQSNSSSSSDRSTGGGGGGYGHTMSTHGSGGSNSRRYHNRHSSNSSYNSSSSRHHNQCYHPLIISNNREHLQSTAALLIGHLSTRPYRTQREQQQMIDTVRYCLQQLRLQHQQQLRESAETDTNSGNNYNYNTFSSSTWRSLLESGVYTPLSTSEEANSDTTTLDQPSDSHLSPPILPTIYSSSSILDTDNGGELSPNANSILLSDTLISSSSSSSSSDGGGGSGSGSASSNHAYYHKTMPPINEPPPAYESLLIKSSSLPSYCHLSMEAASSVINNNAISTLHNNSLTSPAYHPLSTVAAATANSSSTTINSAEKFD